MWRFAMNICTVVKFLHIGSRRCWKKQLKKKTGQIKSVTQRVRVCVCPRLQSIHTEYLQVISKRNEVFWQSDVDTHCYCEGCTGWKTFFINNHSVRQGWNSLPEHNALTNILKNQENVNLRSSFRQSGAKPAALRQQQQKHTGMDDKEFTGGANSFNTWSRAAVLLWLDFYLELVICGSAKGAPVTRNNNDFFSFAESPNDKKTLRNKRARDFTER